MDSLEWMTVILIGLTLVLDLCAISGVTLYSNIWVKTISIVETSFEDDSVRFYCDPDSKDPIILKFKYRNIGKRKLYFLHKTTAVHNLSIMVYFQKGITIIDATRQKKTKAYQGFVSSMMSDLPEMQYIFVPDPLERIPPVMTSLRYGEEEKFEVKIIAPKQPGQYNIIIDMSSDEGELDMYSVQLVVVDSTKPMPEQNKRFWNKQRYENNEINHPSVSVYKKSP